MTMHTRAASQSRGRLAIGAMSWACVIGRSGIAARKREGDGATPRGVFGLVEVLYRPDRVRRPRTALPTRALRPQDGWCDAPGDRNYNRRVRLPYPASAEELWRGDDLYDVIVVLTHNRQPRVHGLGSAVFMHVARAGDAPTAGCVALACRDLLRVLEMAGRSAALRVGVGAARRRRELQA
jgi:L,D-peptidoglycan transpeptidase YkuD (ErfK/YbiS/YcfS/YnhG family)